MSSAHLMPPSFRAALPPCRSRRVERLAQLALALVMVVTPLRAQKLSTRDPGQDSLTAGGTIDLLRFSPDRTGASDTSPAWIAAIRLANAEISRGSPICITVPPGIYLIAAPLPAFAGPGCVVGGGKLTTILKTATTLSGPVLSWDDAWIGAFGGAAYGFNAATMDVASQRAGPILKDLSILGDRTSAPQTAIAFLDHVDFASVEDVDVFFMNGSALSTGRTEKDAEAYTRESHLVNFRAFNSGSATAPVIDLSTTFQGGDATNAVQMFGIDIYAPYGTGLHVGSHTGGISGDDIRIEGIEGNPTGVRADLLEVGDAGRPGSTAGIHLRGLQLVDPYAGSAALHVTGSDSGLTYDLDFEGSIGGGNPLGRGLQIDVGRSSVFRFPFVSTKDTNLTVGPRSGHDIVVDAAGHEGDWTVVNQNPDPTALRFPTFNTAPVSSGLDLQTGRHAPGRTASGRDAVTLGVDNRAVGTASVAAGSYNETVGQGGSALGSANRVSGDFGTAAGQSNTAGQVALAAGYRNTAAGVASAAIGQDNTATGAGSFVTGFNGTDRGRPLWAGAGGAGFLQYGTQPLSATATGTAETSLGGFQGVCGSIPDETAYSVTIHLVARDTVDSANAFSWSLSGALLSRRSGAATTRFSGPAAVFSGLGRGSRASARAAAAPTGCLDVGFTPPAGNAHPWHVGATVETVEVQ